MIEGKKGRIGKRYIRGRRRPKKRIFTEGLKRKPTQESNNTRNRVVGTIIHIHSHQKCHYIDYNERWYQPWKPLLEMLNFSIKTRSWWCCCCRSWLKWVYWVTPFLRMDLDLDLRLWRNSSGHLAGKSRMLEIDAGKFNFRFYTMGTEKRS